MPTQSDPTERQQKNSVLAEMAACLHATGADLGDEAACILTLTGARFRARDINALLDGAVEAARVARARRAFSGKHRLAGRREPINRPQANLSAPATQERGTMSLVGKRSVVVRGHKTSVSLEPDFWRCLASIAHGAGRPIASLIEEVDHNRRHGPQEERNTNLSSALRVFVLKHFAGERHGT